LRRAQSNNKFGDGGSIVLRVELNRIDGTGALPSLRPENVSVRGDEAMIELRLSADHDIELYFPASGDAVRAEWQGLAGDVLAHLAEMDNEVQRVSAEQCARSGYHSRNFEGEIAYINLVGPDAAVLHYFGTGVNTEWDEPFFRVGGQWFRGKPAEPVSWPPSQ
jgi:hypothetical protein